MNNTDIQAALSEMEFASYPRLGRHSHSVVKSLNGKQVKAESKWNNGHSGKGYKTLWYVSGNRIFKKNLLQCITSESLQGS
jgi:hypothetical protein